jgi:AbiEi antitoxin C-terminal domain
MRLLDDFLAPSSVSARETFTVAELSACALDGELFPVDAVYVFCDLPSDVTSRARIVISRVDERCVVAGWSAAWVHDAIDRPPAHHTVALRDGLRIRLSPDRRYGIAQMSFDKSDVMGVIGAHVTTPLRTAIDLARFVSQDSRLDDVLVALMRCAQATARDVRKVLNRGTNLPYKQRAYRRLGAALATLENARGRSFSRSTSV